MDSLRGRVALAAAASLLVVMVLLGVVLVTSTAHDDRRTLDEQLGQRAALLARPATLALAAAEPNRTFPQVRTVGGTILATTDTGVRVLDGGRVVLALGDLPRRLPAGRPAPGLRTIAVDGVRWRSAVRRVPGTAGLVQTLGELAPLERRERALRRRVIVLGIAGVVAAAALAALAVGLVLAPLRRLRATAEAVAATHELDRRVPVEGTREIRDVAGAMNGMLAELEATTTQRERALQATRRFVADAGHELRTPLATIGANLETLVRNPRLAAGDREAVLAETLVDQARMTTLTESLQALARGDAGALGDEAELDVGEVLATAVGAAQARHPEATFRIDAAPALPLHASPTGLRMLVDNLLENAARHGGRDRRVTVETHAAREGGRLRIHVDDDGPGIPEAEREAVLERFVRGSGGAPGGSGLGLSVAAQQAAVLGGTLRIGDAPLGGARLEVEIPT